MESEQDMVFDQYDFTERNYKTDYDRRTLALLYGTSLNRCAFPGCGRKIIFEPNEFDDATITGQIAHIYSRTSKGPRPYPYKNPTKNLINGFDNLILLCADCHILIDRRENTFTAHQIRIWKQEHISGNMNVFRSFLPEQHRVFTIHGRSYRVFNLDATLKEIRDISEFEKMPDGQTKKLEKLDLHFTDDSGIQFQEVWTSVVFPCQKEGRITFLGVVDEDKSKEFIYSFYIHRSGIGKWLKWPQEMKIRVPLSKTSSRILQTSVGFIMLTPMMLTLSWFGYIQFSFLTLMPAVLGSLVGARVINTGKEKIKNLLEKAEKAIQFH